MGLDAPPPAVPDYPGYPPQQPGYPPQPQPGYPPEQPGYPPQQPGYPPQQPGYPPQQPGYPPQQPGYPPGPQPGYPPQAGYPPQQQPVQGYPPAGYPAQAVAVGQPAAMAPNVVVMGGGAQAGTHEWHHGIFDCCEEPGFCCLAWCCPCIAFGQVKERMGESCYGMGCFYVGLVLLGAFFSFPICHTFLTCSNRGQLRTHFNIPGDPCSDWCCHLCCEACSLTQEWDHLEKYPYRNHNFTVVVAQ